MSQRRIIYFGLRDMPIMGQTVRIQQGAIVEELDPETGEWVYVGCCHPDDAEELASNE